jgi:tetratricopeptide (TPR) repeat protein
MEPRDGDSQPRPVAASGGYHERARAALEEALTLHQSFGELENTAHSLDGLGMLSLAEGDPGQASLVEDALALARKVGHVMDTADFLADLGLIALDENDYARAGLLFEESLKVAAPIEDELSIAKCLWGFAALAAVHGLSVRAVRLWAAAAALRYELTAPPSAIRPIEERLALHERQTRCSASTTCSRSALRAAAEQGCVYPPTLPSSVRWQPRGGRDGGEAPGAPDCGRSRGRPAQDQRWIHARAA